MARRSPSRRSQALSSPERHAFSDFLHENRNNELSHRDALAAAQAEHERVREAALRVFQMHELQEEHQRIVEASKVEQERLQREAQIAAEAQRLHALRAQSIPKPTPPPEPVQPPKAASPPPAAPVKQPASTSTPAPVPQESKRAEPAPASRPEATGPSTTAPAPQSKGLFATQSKPAPNPFASTPPTQPPAQSSPAVKPNGIAPTTQPAAAVPKPPVAQSQPAVSAASTKLIQIHQELKKLRSNLQAEARKPGSPLKGQMGEYRREIRVSIGQLTSGKGANTQPINKITATLKNALEGRVPSPPIDVSLYVVGQRQPVQGVPNNDPTLPALFIYLMNICAKGIISQFINEASANTKAADPIGVFTAHIFSHKDFQWRGESLIDILMAKFRVVCPVLFGSRGNDKMEKGRLALGWRKDGPSWITEQSHNDRMTGLGAGYASISLRDFSKSSKANPYPPTNYWKALAAIVNTPANETSNTQYVVLRAMIEGHEQRFINFYGNAAVAALRLALVEFPKKASQTASASGSLQALAEVLRSEAGLSLA